MSRLDDFESSEDLITELLLLLTKESQLVSKPLLVVRHPSDIVSDVLEHAKSEIFRGRHVVYDSSQEDSRPASTLGMSRRERKPDDRAAR